MNAFGIGAIATVDCYRRFMSDNPTAANRIRQACQPHPPPAAPGGRVDASLHTPGRRHPGPAGRGSGAELQAGYRPRAKSLTGRAPGASDAAGGPRGILKTSVRAGPVDASCRIGASTGPSGPRRARKSITRQ
ncbi:protein V57 [Beluga whale alphaherpesvirus 1]|uniref:Protein V57 n=1 Tax=Beluga whale alphaherpesvirus 1 TaxID=1434720 RepID=A0A286MMA1_9ALPH|nr:protein V57 [Beluga whale alphaherpesvirus 1]ASW27127.1 protein V57 [Beluga whale alphaherpesvirus 1]